MTRTKTKEWKGFMLMQRVQLYSGRMGRWQPCPLHNPSMVKYEKMLAREVNGKERYRKIIPVLILPTKSNKKK